MCEVREYFSDHTPFTYPVTEDNVDELYAQMVKERMEFARMFAVDKEDTRTVEEDFELCVQSDTPWPPAKDSHLEVLF